MQSALDDARVTSCHLSQCIRVQSALDNVVSVIGQALPTVARGDAGGREGGGGGGASLRLSAYSAAGRGRARWVTRAPAVGWRRAPRRRKCTAHGELPHRRSARAHHRTRRTVEGQGRRCEWPTPSPKNARHVPRHVAITATPHICKIGGCPFSTNRLNPNVQ